MRWTRRFVFQKKEHGRDVKAFSADAVETQLERIMASQEFVNGAKLGQFLSYVVSQKLVGAPEKIKQYAIATEALGYGQGFDPMSNPTVRILAGRLRRALDRYYRDQGTADPIRIEIPKGSYVPVFTEREMARRTTAATEISRIPGELSREAEDLTVAVVAFENLSKGEDAAIMAVGLTAEVVVSLTRFAELTVLGPLADTTSSQGDLSEMLRQYGARFALQGWVRSSGSRIRITTDLLDTSVGTSLWARTFEYDLEETSLFEIEDAVTSQVAGAIGDGLGVIFRRLQSESYRKYLKLNDVTKAVLGYNYAWTLQDTQAWRRANDAIAEALVKHPNDALLIALQSNTYYADYLHALELVPEARDEMRPLADKAVALDADLQVAQYNMVVQNAFAGNAAECVEAARKVVALNPNHARVLSGCAIATTSVGAYEFGKELIERAKRLNPQYPGWFFWVDFVINFHSEQYEDAWANARLIETPGLIWEPLTRAAALGMLGRADEAQPFVEKLLQLKPDFKENARDYIGRLFVTDEHVDMVCNGLSRCQRSLCK